MIDFDYPKTVVEAIERIISKLPLKDRAFIATLPGEDLHLVRLTLGAFIRDELGFATGNKALIESCRALKGDHRLTADQAVLVFVEELWKVLRRTHSMRLLKSDGDQGPVTA
jgi:hypothetical protein